MLKGIADTQIKLASTKTASLAKVLESLEEEKLSTSIISDKRIRLRCRINIIKYELEYWRGVKNTAELFADEILMQEQRDLDELNEALADIPIDLSVSGGPVTGNIE